MRAMPKLRCGVLFQQPPHGMPKLRCGVFLQQPPHGSWRVDVVNLLASMASRQQGSHAALTTMDLVFTLTPKGMKYILW